MGFRKWQRKLQAGPRCYHCWDPNGSREEKEEFEEVGLISDKIGFSSIHFRKLYTDGNKYEKGLEIIRSDGLEANVLLQEDRYLEEGQKHFLFTVWHPKEKKASDKDSYQEDMEKVADEVDLDDFEMC